MRLAGLELVSSYVSLTEVSEYAAGVPEEMRQARLYPQLPPEGKPAFCFYPMSKRRSAEHNWYALDFETRKALMMGHGTVGRTFHGRIVQLITASTGLDDFEWGVTLFGAHPDDVKDCVYTMRFDEASAHYAEFGPFFVRDGGRHHRRTRLGVGPVATVDSVDSVDAQMATLSSVLMNLGDVVVAFSGGADSAFLAKMATDTLGSSHALVATAVSPSLAPEELADCEALAREWDLNWRPVTTNEFENPAYVANDGARCYHCKTSLLDAVAPIARERGAIVVLGVNTDDLSEHRPGQSAAIERGASFPLVESGFTKSDVRAASKRLGLRTWDKPAAACLSSRLPYGTPVTIEALGKVGRAEAALRALGFGQLRVRHYGDVARVELETDDLAAAVERRDEVVAAVRAAGYAYVTLDLEGFRSGNLNDSLTTRGVQ